MSKEQRFNEAVFKRDNEEHDLFSLGEDFDTKFDFLSDERLGLDQKKTSKMSHFLGDMGIDIKNEWEWKGVFFEHEKGIGINYLNVEGKPYSYMTERKQGLHTSNSQRRSYHTVRLEKPLTYLDDNRQIKTMKYQKPKNVAELPFVTGTHKYQGDHLNEIETLIFTEGEKKAYTLCKLIDKSAITNMTAVGLGGIQSIARPIRCDVWGDLIGAEPSKPIYELLQLFPNLTKIIYLHDADALERDILSRKQFFSSIKRFSIAYGKTYECTYAVIDSRKTVHKGADDVIVGHFVPNIDTFFKEYTKQFNVLDPEMAKNLWGMFNKSRTADERALDWFFQRGVKFNELSMKFEVDGKECDDRNLRSLIIDCHSYNKVDAGSTVVENLDALETINGGEVIINKTIEHKDTCPKGTVEDVLYSDKIPSYHPIKDFFEERYEAYSKQESDEIKKFCDHLILDENASISNDFKNSALRKWFIGAIAQTFENNSVNLLFPVIISKVNTGKTHMLKEMFPSELMNYVSDWVANDTEQNTRMKLTQNFCVYNDELHGLSKKEGNELRHLISAHSFEYRPPYGREMVTKQKTASFIATSNHSDVVLDPKNNRRTIPIEIEHRNKELFDEIDFTKLWMEAYIGFVEGEAYNLTEEEVEHILSASSHNAMESSERDLVEKYVRESEDAIPLKLTEIKIHILQLAPELKTLNDRKLREALSEFGYINKVYKMNGKAIRGYKVRIESQQVPADSNNPFM